MGKREGEEWGRMLLAPHLSPPPVLRSRLRHLVVGLVLNTHQYRLPQDLTDNQFSTSQDGASVIRNKNAPPPPIRRTPSLRGLYSCLDHDVRFFTLIPGRWKQEFTLEFRILLGFHNLWPPIFVLLRRRLAPYYKLSGGLWRIFRVQNGWEQRKSVWLTCRAMRALATLRCHNRSAVVNDRPVEARVCMYTRPTDWPKNGPTFLRQHNSKTHWPISVIQNCWTTFWTYKVQTLYSDGGCDPQKSWF